MNSMNTLMEWIDLDKVANKRVLIRQDLNVPIRDGEISSDARIQASLPTLRALLASGAKVLVMSHLGRPKEGGSIDDNAQYSLEPIARYLSDALNQDVALIRDYLDNEPELQAGQLVLLENVRFNLGEKSNDSKLSKRYARLCDLYVMDAFGTAHRKQASTYGVASDAPMALAGPLLVRELESLEQALKNPKRPLVAIVGGAKVSSKLTVLRSLSQKVDQLIVGGGIANTFLASKGLPIGQSLAEPSLVDEAKELLTMTDIPLPEDVNVGQAFSSDTPAEIKEIGDVQAHDMIFDIGPKAQSKLKDILQSAGTIIWNGPVGVFEFDQFSQGTEQLALAIANSSAFSIAGGGDTLAAIDKFNLSEDISYISTGGGAFLEYVEGKILPAVEILQQRKLSASVV